ncbi:MAG TPA: DUF1501 domain-containing protein [Blastocatellia bacterium]|nr:DUF1501 domain-containing protein [Blastocatellia bacterium]
MPVNRRQFIKRSAGMVAVGLVAPNIWLREARAQSGRGRRVFVVIQLAGGTDGLNTVIPYSESRYRSLRPNLGFLESELKDEQTRSTVISDRFGLHPAMSEIKSLYDGGKVAIVLGVGYPNPNLSHFLSMDIYHTANPVDGRGNGWLGRYADIALFGKTGLTAASLGGLPVKSFLGQRVVLPNILNFDLYDFLGDPGYPADYANQVRSFRRNNAQVYPDNSYIATVARSGVEALDGANRVKTSIGSYQSSVAYPANNPLAAGLKMAAQMIVTIPELELLYVQMGGFDTHAEQIGENRLAGAHALLLRYFSQGVKAFYDDMVEHGMADQVVMMQWSEFGRRPEENASLGTDHGTAVPMFVIGNPVRGGLYGDQPSLTDLDAGNLRHTVDFRSVYATLLDKWLVADSNRVLGGTFSDLGFMS